MIRAYIKAIEYFVPPKKLTNKDLISDNPSWDVVKIYDKTGIANRYIAEDNVTAVDLAISAGKHFFTKHSNDKNKIDYLIFCTQSPDYFLPTSACIIQNALGLNSNLGAIDVNQGCSGFVYSLSLAKGLIETSQATNVLIITSETYSKYINKKDKSVRTLFGDGAACSLISNLESRNEQISKVTHGTDGSGANHLIVPHGAHRHPLDESSNVLFEDKSSNLRSPSDLYMNGNAIYTFTMKKIPIIFNEILESNNMTLNDIDLVVFHQANKFILDTIQKKLQIPEEKMHRSYEEYGNTVSSTIPIGLKLEMDKKKNSAKKTYLILGFGVGLSWAGAIIKL